MTDEPKSVEEAHEERRKILSGVYTLQRELSIVNQHQGHNEVFATLFAELQAAHARATFLKRWIKTRNTELNAARYQQAHDPTTDLEKNGHNKQLRIQNSELKALVRDYHQKFKWLMSNLGNCECVVCQWLSRDASERKPLNPTYIKRAAERGR